MKRINSKRIVALMLSPATLCIYSFLSLSLCLTASSFHHDGRVDCSRERMNHCLSGLQSHPTARSGLNELSASSSYTSATSSSDHIQSFFPFSLDSWQLEAGMRLMDGNSVIVCAPTGAGKTVVGEAALHLALKRGKRAIYTTPLKALSNQKFMELRKIFGTERVGLSTGDVSVNRGADVMVMTTEVYRNMAWRAASTLSKSDEDLTDNAMVVLDEFHYMGQPGRGTVWEECVITSPKQTQIVALSATLPNADDLAGWIQSVTQRDTSLIEAGGTRPVPLRYLFASSSGISPIFKDRDAGPGSPKVNQSTSLHE